MDSFEDANDILSSLQPSDHEEDNLSLKQSESNDEMSLSYHNDSNSTTTALPYLTTHDSTDNLFKSNKPYTDKVNNGVDKAKFECKMEMENNRNLNNSDSARLATTLADKNVDKSQLLTIIHFLKKYNFRATEEILLKETSNLINEDDFNSNLSFFFESLF